MEYHFHLIQLDTSRKGPDQGEETEDGNEQKLEVIATEAEGVLLFLNVGTLLGQDLARFGGPRQEGGDGGTLLTFQLGQPVIVHELCVLGKAGLSGLLVIE